MCYSFWCGLGELKFCSADEKSLCYTTSPPTTSEEETSLLIYPLIYVSSYCVFDKAKFTYSHSSSVSVGIPGEEWLLKENFTYKLKCNIIHYYVTCSHICWSWVSAPHHVDWHTTVFFSEHWVIPQFFTLLNLEKYILLIKIISTSST